MKKISVTVTTETERSIMQWATETRDNPSAPPPTIEEALSVALDDFAKERKDLVERLAEARRFIEERHGRR